MRGAAAYVQKLVSSGAKVVYLTGRDEQRMKIGTETNFRAHHFPLDGTHTVLLMKPTKDLDDLIFKKQAFNSISVMGTVVGAFENEPKNINAMGERFPEASLIFLDTIHSPAPDQTAAKVVWVKDFVTRQY